MKLKKRGKHISPIEILNISPNGIWIYVSEKEFFLDQAHYPWFAEAKLCEIFDVELVGEKHLHWPSLDIDLHLESLEEPHKYPLVYR